MSDDVPTLPIGGLSCPIPIEDYPSIQLAHGGGGRLSKMLVDKLFVPAFDNEALSRLHDGALLEVEASRLAFSTDSFVIHPLDFPGGNIGSLAIHGTVNDLAMCGAKPLWMSAGLILEEGLEMEALWRYVLSMRDAAQAAGVRIVTGDTKVVDRGKGDGIFINTTGLGVVPADVDLDPRRVRPGDRIILSGEIAVHGVTILSVREGLEFDTTLESDAASLNLMVDAILDAGGRDVHVLRDPTRGGVSSALNEIADQAGVGMILEEGRIPIHEQVRGACEILGLDPLYVANEGKCVAIVAPDVADAVVEAMRRDPHGRHAAVVGEVMDAPSDGVHLRSLIGGLRVVDMIAGEQLPRIC